MTRHDFVDELESYLDGYDGSTPLPERVRMSVRGQLPHVTQQPAWWPARRLPTMTLALRVGLATAAVVAMTVIGSLLAEGQVGGPDTDDPTAAPSPISSAMELPTGGTALEAGTYSLRPRFPARVTFEVPEGWVACVLSDVEQGVCTPTEDAGSVTVLAVDNVAAVPCAPGLLDPPAGRSVDAFLSAVANLSGFTVSEPVTVTRGEVSGQRVVVTAPGDPPCQALSTWSVSGRTNGVAPGEVNVVEVFDVGGRLVAVAGAYRPSQLSPAQVAEISEIMNSVEIRP